MLPNEAISMHNKRSGRVGCQLWKTITGGLEGLIQRSKVAMDEEVMCNTLKFCCWSPGQKGWGIVVIEFHCYLWLFGWDYDHLTHLSHKVNHFPGPYFY